MSIQPPTYTGLELDVMRGGFGLAVLLTLDMLQVFGPDRERSAPVGIARVADLGWLVTRRNSLRHLAQVAVLAYVLGFGTTWALLYLSAYLVLNVTAMSSNGAVNHAYHLVVVVSVVQCAAVLIWNALSEPALHDAFAGTREATAVWWSVQAMLAVYFTSGLSKVVNSRAEWIARSPGLLVGAAARMDTAASMGERYQTAARTRRVQRLIDALFDLPAIARLLFAAGLLVELAAPLGLLGENALLVVGIALLALHQANARLLTLPCYEYQILVLAYCVNVPRLWS